MTVRKASIVRHLVAALAVAAVTGAAAHPAEACGGGWFPEVEIDHRITGIAMAEKQLKEGKYVAAAGSVVRMIPHVRNYKSATKDPIINRALRVLAVATVRSDGVLGFAHEVPAELHGSWIGKESGDRDANLLWAVQAMRAADRSKPNDATVQSELGEALAKVDALHGEARELLGKLAEKDLLTTPEAYAALATLRAESGDQNGKVAALERCRAMAKDARVCGGESRS
jgi:hypothetical protein